MPIPISSATRTDYVVSNVPFNEMRLDCVLAGEMSNSLMRIFPYMPGCPLADVPIGEEEIRAVGRLLGRLHKVALDFRHAAYNGKGKLDDPPRRPEPQSPTRGVGQNGEMVQLPYWSLERIDSGRLAVEENIKSETRRQLLTDAFNRCDVVVSNALWLAQVTIAPSLVLFFCATFNSFLHTHSYTRERCTATSIHGI